MQVEVRLFGPEATVAGTDRAVVELDLPATCGALRRAMRAQTPALASSLDWARFAVNGRFATDETTFDAADELALIGMVSGG